MATTMDAIPTTEEEGQSSSLLHDNSNHVAQDARFSCNICFEAVTEPVVTRCGHLYCWPCLYKWLAPGMTPPERTSLGLPRVLRRPLDESRRVCPVCKSECSVPTVVPIYVRNDPNKEAPFRPEQSQQSQEEELQPPQAVHVPNDHNFAPIDHPNDDDDNSNMGLDIDDDDLDDDNEDLGLDIDDNQQQQQHVIPTTVTTTDNGTSLGLRQRRRNESRDELNTALVPTRPVPSRDRAATSDTNISSSAVAAVPANNTGPTPNHHARATLSYGLVLAMHQTLLNATSDATPDTTAATESIPSIHYPRPRSPAESDTANVWDQEDPASTVFLSRLLLGLSLFVLFCLLSF